MQPRVEEWCRPAARRLVVAEAVAQLLWARLAVAFCSFQRLTRVFGRPARQPELMGDARVRTRQEVRSAILTVYQRFPGKTTCFHRAMAAQAMLRRRGIGVTLYYGAATLPESGLATHAWVQDGAEGVVGHRTAQRDGYQILARYPDPSQKRSQNGQ